MTNVRWLKWAITRYYRSHGYRVTMKPTRADNAMVDGVAVGPEGERIAEKTQASLHAIRGYCVHLSLCAPKSGTAPSPLSTSRIPPLTRWPIAFFVRVPCLARALTTDSHRQFIAVARKMLVSIYHVLKPHDEYHGQRDELLERKINRLRRTVDSSLQAK